MSRHPLTFESYPTQREFLLDRSPHVAFVGGYGCGKSKSACRKAMLGAVYNPGCTSLMAAPTYRMMLDTIWRQFQEELDEQGVPYSVLKSELAVEIPWWGHRVLFRSADRPDKLKGPNLSHVVLDEAGLCDVAAHDVLLSRIREPRAQWRFLALTGTPEGMGWLYDVCEGPDGYYVLYRMGTAENLDLPRAYVDRLFASYSEAHRDAYLKGEFRDLFTGRVYGSFDRGTHVSAFEWGNPDELEHDLDFNVDPACSVVTYRDRFGNFFVWDEIRIEGGVDTPAVCREFIRRYGDFTGTVVVGGDAAGSARSTKAAVSDYHLIRQAYDAHFGQRFGGIRVPRANPRVVDRVNAMNAALTAGTIHVHERCRHLIDDLVRVAWKSGSREIDKRDDKTTHLSDALGYRIVRDAPAISNTRSDPSILAAMRKGERRRVAL